MNKPQCIVNLKSVIMKNVTVKKALVAACVTLAGVSGFNCTTMAQTPTVDYSLSIKHQKDAISNDVSRVKYQQQRVDAIKEKRKQERANGTVSKVTITSLSKAQADLKRERDYLKADKSSLMLQHKAHVAAHKSNVRAQQRVLLAERRNLDADLMKGNNAAIAHTAAIIETKKQITSGQKKLRAAKLERNSDLLAVNKQIGDAKGQSVVSLSFENGFAQASNLVLK